jgi:hypothetical protein
MARRNKAAGASARSLRPGSGQARIIPNKNRRLQIAPTSRRLFGKKAEDEFLEWFAATCNCSLSARKVGFHYRTVLRHWRDDAEFGGRCEEALRLGYPRLEELALRGAEAALRPKRRRRVKGDRPAPAETLAMTPQDALQLLREHKRGLAAVAFGAGAGSGQARKPGRAPTVASNGEVFAALVKRLKAFQIRVREEDAARAVDAGEETPPPRDARSPSPGKPGEEEEGLPPAPAEGSEAVDPSTAPDDVRRGPESGRSSPRDDLGLPGAIRPDSPRSGEDLEGGGA